MKSSRQDDLTVITGLGTAYQKWLGEQLHVASYEALSELTVAEVEVAAKRAGKKLAPALIADWIEEAQLLAAQQGEGMTQKGAVAVAETAVTHPAPTWEPFASFVVEYQERPHSGQPQRRTRVHYMEADEETTWPGIEREQIGLWIEQHVKVPEPKAVVAKPTVVQKPTAPAVKAKHAATPKVVVKLLQVRMRQQPDYLSVVDLTEPKRPFLGHAHHEKPVTLEIDFAPEPAAAEPQQTAMTAHCHVRNLSVGEKAHYLEMHGNSAPHSFTYRCDLLLVEPGIYCLGVLVRKERPLGMAYFELPKLNVL